MSGRLDSQINTGAADGVARGLYPPGRDPAAPCQPPPVPAHCPAVGIPCSALLWRPSL